MAEFDAAIEPDPETPPADNPATRVAIVYHSGYGHTGRQAQAVKTGAEQVSGVEALLLTVEEAQ